MRGVPNKVPRSPRWIPFTSYLGPGVWLALQEWADTRGLPAYKALDLLVREHLASRGVPVQDPPIASDASFLVKVR
jgi:hypothetical protein